MIDEYNVLRAVAAGTVKVTATSDSGVSTTFTVTATGPDFIIHPGDVNDDGVINIIDLIKMKKYIVGMIILTGRSFVAADLQEDQIINSQDLIKLRRILLGIERRFSSVKNGLFEYIVDDNSFKKVATFNDSISHVEPYQ